MTLHARKGRPPIDATGAGTRVSVRLTAITYDALYAIASEHGLDVAAVIRDAIDHHLTADRRQYPRVLSAETAISVSQK